MIIVMMRRLLASLAVVGLSVASAQADSSPWNTEPYTGLPFSHEETCSMSKLERAKIEATALRHLTRRGWEKVLTGVYAGMVSDDDSISIALTDQGKCSLQIGKRRFKEEGAKSFGICGGMR